jgi:hypothetical protein
MMNTTVNVAINSGVNVPKPLIGGPKEWRGLGTIGQSGKFINNCFKSSYFYYYSDSWSRPRPREYRPGVRDRGYSPSLDPAPKRLRHDYYADSYYNHYTPYHQSTHRYVHI